MAGIRLLISLVAIFVANQLEAPPGRSTNHL